MSREENIEVIESLYGIDEDDVRAILEEIGYKALSDKAIEMLAECQQERESKYCIQKPVINMSTVPDLNKEQDIQEVIDDEIYDFLTTKGK